MIKEFLNSFKAKSFKQKVLQAGFFVFFLNIYSPGLAAQPPFMPVDYLMDEAKTSFEQKDYSKSVQYLSQVLISNPHLKMAHELLNRLAVADQLSAEEKADIIIFQDLAQFNNRLIFKIDYFLQKRNNVLKNLGQLGYTNDYLKNYLIPFQVELIQWRESNEKKFADLQNEKNKLSGFKQLLKFSALKRDELAQELDNVERQFNHLRLLNRDQLPNRLALDIVVASNEHPGGQFKKADQTNQNNLESQMVSLQQQIIKLQHLINEKDTKVNQLTEELARLSSGGGATNLNNQNKFSPEDFIELQSRFELGQKIIQEKDKEIQLLQAQGNNQSADVHPPIERKEPIGFSKSVLENQLVEVSGILEIYKLKLSDLNQNLKSNLSNIVDLENKLTLVQTKLFEKDQLIQKTEQGMQKLEQKLLELQNELDNLRQSYLENNLLKIKNRIGLQQQLNDINEFLEVELKDF